jgi:hypothetical protein
MQAVSKDGQSSHKLLVQMSLSEALSPGLDVLLAKVADSGPRGLIAEAMSDDDTVSLGSGDVDLADREEDADQQEMKRPGSGEIDTKSRWGL